MARLERFCTAPSHPPILRYPGQETLFVKGCASYVLATFPALSRQEQLPSVWEPDSHSATCPTIRGHLTSGPGGN